VKLGHKNISALTSF